MSFQIVKLVDAPVNINVNVNPVGAYSNSTTYSVGDVVTYNGLSYICKQTSTGNLPTNTTYWQLIYDDTQKFITSHNGTGATLYKGTIVYFSGATGSNPNIVKAQADTDAHSAQTFGVVYEDIANNSTGKVLGFGLVDGLDTRSTATNPFTSDTLAAGDILYLSPTTAGYVTKTKPSAPDHLVYVGFVVQTSPTDGRIVYRVQNGYELDELHNVAITSVANNQSLFYDSASGLWKNRAVAATDINANVSNTEFGYLDGVTSGIQSQLNGKEPTITAGTSAQYYRGDKTFQTLDKTAVGLGNVDNTSDANKPVSTAQASAIAAKQDTITGGATSITSSNLTASKTLVSDASGKVAASSVSSTTLGYLDATSSIQTQLDGKQASLGYTAENTANKDTDGTLAANSDTKYASQKATKTYVDTGLATKQNTLAYTPEDSANKDTDGTLTANLDTKYASQKATKTYADTKLAKNSNLSDVSNAATSFGNIKQNATTSATGVVQLAGDLGGTATSVKVPELVSKKIGALGIISHSWAAGSALSSTGTPQFEQQGPVGRLAGLLGIANENQEHLGIAGSYLARQYTAFGTQFSGWAGAYSFVYPASNSNINDVATTTRSVPALPSPKAWTIIHGINDAGIYSSSTTATNFTQTTLGYKNALRSTLSRLRAGALYSSYYNSSGAITWDSSLAFGGTGTWSDVVSTGQNTGPAYKSNTSNGGTVTITLPTNFTGGTVAVSFIGQVYAWSKLQAAITSTSSTTVSIASANASDFPASLNYVIQVDSEQMLVTGGQNTATLTVTRGVNGTTAATHALNAEVYMVSGMTIDFSGTASGATGSLAIQAQGVGGGGLGRSSIGLVKRFTMTAADAGKTIICTSANKITGDTYTAAQFDSWWIETSDPPPIVVANVIKYSYVLPYAGLSPTQWTSFNTAITDVVAEFDSAVKVADINAPFEARSGTLRATMTAGTTTCSITANDATTFASLGTGFVITKDGEDMLVTAQTNVGGSNIDLTVTRGYNGTTAAAHSTTGRYVSDATWFHTDNIHPNGYGHAVIAKTIYDTFKTMTSLNTYQQAISNGNITQDNRLPVLGIRDNTYMIHHNNVALSNATSFTLNKLWYFPFYVPQKCILIGAGIATGSTTAGTSTNVRVGLYDVNVDRYSPGALIKEFGTKATTALNTLVELTTYQVLNPGWYFLAYVNQGTTAGTVKTMTNLGYTANIPYHMESSHPALAGSTSFSPFFSDTASITGALPTTAAWQQDNGPIPFPVLHFRAKHYV